MACCIQTRNTPQSYASYSMLQIKNGSYFSYTTGQQDSIKRTLLHTITHKVFQKRLTLNIFMTISIISKDGFWCYQGTHEVHEFNMKTKLWRMGFPLTQYGHCLLFPTTAENWILAAVVRESTIHPLDLTHTHMTSHTYISAWRTHAVHALCPHRNGWIQLSSVVVLAE